MDFEDVETVAVLGAGNMGHGIAEVAALAGYAVNMRDVSEEIVQDGYEDIEWSLDKLAEHERITREAADGALDRISPFVELEPTVQDADFVIEAVPEQMDIKKEVYREVEAHLPERAVIATNTSSLSITELSEVTSRPERFCGMHFFNPPVRMQLVEVIAGEHTDEATLELAESLAEAFDKTPVRVHRDAPGFIVNRVLVPLMNEACWLVSNDESTVEEIDSTTKFDMGLPMGTFELGDQVGNDVTLHVLEYMHDVLGDGYEPAPLLARVVEEDRLGKKTGQGFYDYENGGASIPPDAGSESVERLLVAVMANEVAKLIETDVAQAPAIDKAVKLGAGFPDGPASLAEEYGLESLLDLLEERHDTTGHPRYEPADYLRDTAVAGTWDVGKDGGGDEEPGDPESRAGSGTGSDSGSEFSDISVEYPGEDVGHLILDREARMNSISERLLDELGRAVDELEADSDVRAILVTGAGDRAFSAGADVTSMTGVSQLDHVELSRKGQRVFGKLEACDVPTVAGIDGYALGGGMELATCCDLRIASRRSEMGQPELNLGLMPGWGATQRLQRIVGMGRAKEIILTADRFDAETMADYGFVNQVVDAEAFDDRAFDLAADLAAGPPIAQKFVKRAMSEGWEDADAGLEIESQAFGLLVETEDLMEGISAFANDEEPEFEGR